uniref:Box C/D snoRNA protein 1-like n=1 Tax=Sinocyclocheilus grahami TaxID=75366 RepID=A0A672PWU5_SINGR
MALSSCDVCETKEAKYRCPSCRKHTCSLACVQQHKMVSGCCGVRDKTAFVPLAEFNEINLLNDYRVLEDTARLTQQSNRDRVLLRSHRHPKEVRGMWMIRKARAVKVTLRFLPKVFSKHRENRTVFRRAEGRFYWHLKIHFPQSDAVYSERCPDNRQLDQILNDYIHPSESDPVKRQKYVSLRQTSTRFLNATFIPLLYLELDLKTTLQENLMQKTIVEYPEVFVVLQQHSQQYLTRRPERSNVVASASVTRTSCSLAEPHSEALVHVPKKPKVSEDDELEDGEIRSEGEDGNTEDDDGDAENKLPAMHPDGNDDRDEEEVEMKDCPHNSVQDAREDDGNQNKVVSVNITSKTEEIMMVSQGPEEADSTETVTADARRLCADDKLEENIHSNAGLPEDHGVQDKNCDNGAMHDKDGKTDTQHDSCIAVHHANVQIQVKLNMHEENADIYSSGSENQANM